jgi:tetratricopeptide (TPR) repeat protein
MNINRAQVTLILGAVVVIVLLLFANTKLPKKVAEKGVVATENKQEIPVESIIDEARKAMSVEKQESLAVLESKLNTQSAEAFEGIIAFWEKENNPVVAAFYSEQKATSFPTEQNWEAVANRYYKAVRFVEKEAKQPLFDKAIASFEKVLLINTNNTNAKIDLAACYVEGSAQPMKGIGLLREVEKTDSNNVKLQQAFANFSMQSGQFDKAIVRFEKVLHLKPDLIDTYLYLADIYRQQGNTKKTIENLEKYAALTEDLEAKTEVQGYIDKLKNN